MDLGRGRGRGHAGGKGRGKVDAAVDETLLKSHPDTYRTSLLDFCPVDNGTVYFEKDASKLDNKGREVGRVEWISPTTIKCVCLCQHRRTREGDQRLCQWMMTPVSWDEVRDLRIGWFIIAHVPPCLYQISLSCLFNNFALLLI